MLENSNKYENRYLKKILAIIKEIHVQYSECQFQNFCWILRNFSVSEKKVIVFG